MSWILFELFFVLCWPLPSQWARSSMMVCHQRSTGCRTLSTHILGEGWWEQLVSCLLARLFGRGWLNCSAHLTQTWTTMSPPTVGTFARGRSEHFHKNCIFRAPLSHPSRTKQDNKVTADGRYICLWSCPAFPRKRHFSSTIDAPISRKTA